MSYWSLSQMKTSLFKTESQLQGQRHHDSNGIMFPRAFDFRTFNQIEYFQSSLGWKTHTGSSLNGLLQSSIPFLGQGRFHVTRADTKHLDAPRAVFRRQRLRESLQ